MTLRLSANGVASADLHWLIDCDEELSDEQVLVEARPRQRSARLQRQWKFLDMCRSGAEQAVREMLRDAGALAPTLANWTMEWQAASDGSPAPGASLPGDPVALAYRLGGGHEARGWHRRGERWVYTYGPNKYVVSKRQAIDRNRLAERVHMRSHGGLRLGALHEAALGEEHSAAALVPILLQSGADPLVCNSSGQLPLHIAASRGNIDFVRELLRCPRVVSRAQSRLEDFRGRTALCCALHSLQRVVGASRWRRGMMALGVESDGPGSSTGANNSGSRFCHWTAAVEVAQRQRGVSHGLPSCDPWGTHADSAWRRAWGKRGLADRLSDVTTLLLCTAFASSDPPGEQECWHRTLDDEVRGDIFDACAACACSRAQCLLDTRARLSGASERSLPLLAELQFSALHQACCMSRVERSCVRRVLRAAAEVARHVGEVTAPLPVVSRAADAARTACDASEYLIQCHQQRRCLLDTLCGWLCAGSSGIQLEEELCLQDNSGRTALHHAVACGDLLSCARLLEWALTRGTDNGVRQTSASMDEQALIGYILRLVDQAVDAVEVEEAVEASGMLARDGKSAEATPARAIVRCVFRMIEACDAHGRTVLHTSIEAARQRRRVLGAARRAVSCIESAERHVAVDHGVVACEASDDAEHGGHCALAALLIGVAQRVTGMHCSAGSVQPLLERRDAVGNAPLHVAASLGEHAIISLLLAGGAKVNLRAGDHYFRRTASVLANSEPSVVHLSHDIGSRRGISPAFALCPAATRQPRILKRILACASTLHDETDCVDPARPKTRHAHLESAQQALWHIRSVGAPGTDIISAQRRAKAAVLDALRCWHEKARNLARLCNAMTIGVESPRSAFSLFRESRPVLGGTALFLAIKAASTVRARRNVHAAFLDTIRTLLQHQADTTIADESNCCFMMHVGVAQDENVSKIVRGVICAQGHASGTLGVVRGVREACRACKNSSAMIGVAPLEFAAGTGQLQIVKLLQQYGASLLRSPTALHRACAWSSPLCGFGGDNDVEGCMRARAGIVHELLNQLDGRACSRRARVHPGSKGFVRAVVNSAAPAMLSARHEPSSNEVRNALAERHAASLRTPLGIAFWGTAGFCNTFSSLAADCAAAKVACRDENFACFVRACTRSRHRASVLGMRNIHSPHIDDTLLSALFHFGAGIGNVNRASAEASYPDSLNSPCSVDYHYQIGSDLLMHEALASHVRRNAPKLVRWDRDENARDGEEHRFAILFGQLRSSKPQRTWRIGALNVLTFLEMFLPPLPRGAFDYSKYRSEAVADDDWCWWKELSTNYFSTLHCIARRPNYYMAHNDEQSTSRFFEAAGSDIEILSVQLLADVWPRPQDKAANVLDSIRQARKRWSRSVLQRWRLCLRRAVACGYRNLTRELTSRGVRCFDVSDLDVAGNDTGMAVPLVSLIAISEAMWYRCACTWPANEHVSVDVVCEIDELREHIAAYRVSSISLCRVVLASLAGIAASAGHLDAIAVALADICWQTDGPADLWMTNNPEEQLKQALVEDDKNPLYSKRAQAMLLCLRMAISSCYEPARTADVWAWLMPQFTGVGLNSKLHENLLPSVRETEQGSTAIHRTNMLVACAAAGHAHIVSAILSHLPVSVSSDAGAGTHREFLLPAYVGNLCWAAERAALGAHDRVALLILRHIEMDRDTMLLGGWRILRAACWRGSVAITRWFLENSDYKSIYKLSANTGFCAIKYARAAGHAQTAQCLSDANVVPSKGWRLTLCQSTAYLRDLEPRSSSREPTQQTVLLCGVFREIMCMNEASTLSEAEHFAFFWPRELRSSLSLHWLPAAAAIGLPGIVQALLDAGAADVGFAGGKGSVDSPFCCASTCALSPSVTTVGQQRESQLRTALGWATVSGNCESVGALLLAGADPDGMVAARSPWQGHVVAPIIEATRRHSWDVACALVRAGADISANSASMGQKLMHSIVMGSVEAGGSGAADGRDTGEDMMRLLTLVQLHSQQLAPEHSLLTACDDGGVGPLETAAALGKVNLVLWLLRNGVTAECAATSPCKYALQWLPSAKYREWFSHFALSEARRLSVEVLSEQEIDHRTSGRGHQAQSLLSTLHCIHHTQQIVQLSSAPSTMSMRHIATHQKQLRPVMHVLNLEEQLALLSSRKERNMTLQTPLAPWLIRQYCTYRYRNNSSESASLDSFCGRLTDSNKLRGILEIEMQQTQPFHDGSHCFPARFMQQRIVYHEDSGTPVHAPVDEKVSTSVHEAMSTASYAVHDQHNVPSALPETTAESTVLLHGLPRDHQHSSCMGVYRMTQSTKHGAEVACAFEQVLSLASVPIMRPHALYFMPAPAIQRDKLGHWFVSSHVGKRSARLVGTVSTAHTQTCVESNSCDFQAASQQFYAAKLDAHCWPTSAETKWRMSKNAFLEPLRHEMNCSVTTSVTNDWIPLARASMGTSNLHVVGLSPDTAYEFRVVASPSSSNRKVLGTAEASTRQLHFGDRVVHIASVLRRWLCHSARQDCRQTAFDRIAGRTNLPNGPCCTLDRGMPGQLLLEVEAELLAYEQRSTRFVKPPGLGNAAQHACSLSAPTRTGLTCVPVPERNSGEGTTSHTPVSGAAAATPVDSAEYVDKFSTFVDLMTSSCEVEPHRLVQQQQKLSALQEAVKQLKENRSMPYTNSANSLLLQL